MINKGDIKLANVKWKMPYDIYIGRTNVWLDLEGSVFANPYLLKRESDRELILQNYEDHARSTPAIIEALPTLKDKTLGCYCCEFSNETGLRGKKCHGLILIKLYDEFVK